jgi:archaellum component FlaG (FlaF/FlaG flagellin family)
MTRFLLDFTIITGILIIGNIASETNLTTTSFASILDTVNTVNKSGGGSEHLGINNILELEPDKITYRPGETVVITVKNNGAESLTFPDAAMGLLIENVDTKESFGFIAAQVLTLLQPGQSKSIEWDQRGHDGTQANEGEYKVSVTTVPDQTLLSSSAYSHFQIKEEK